MRLVTLRTGSAAGSVTGAAAGGGATRVGRVDGDGSDDDVVVEVPLPSAAGGGDVGALLTLPGWRAIAAAADGQRHRLGDLDLAPVVPRPGKVVCVGLNYRAHIREMGRDLPQHPTLFAKFTSSLTGPYDDVEAPPEDEAMDWEGELVVVVGSRCRRVAPSEAASKIAGYTVADDVSMRTWQFRSPEWLAGKVWDASTPVGPALVTSDEWQVGPRLTTTVNGEQMQSASTGDLVFTPERLLSDVSTMLTLEPGDLLLTGTPGGVGRARTPARYLTPGDVVEVSVDGLGAVRNRVVPTRGAAVGTQGRG